MSAEIVAVKPSELRVLLASTIPAGLPVLVTGAPGIGKSEICQQAADDCGAHFLLSHPVVEDPTVPAGMPWMVAGQDHADFVPFGTLYAAMHAKDRTVWMIDDLGQATPATQAAYMQLLLARQCNGHVVPDCVTFVAATNRRTDRAGVSGILEPVKSRFTTIVELKPDLDDWCTWAFAHNIPVNLIAFLRWKIDLLFVHNPSADLTNSANPRTWTNLARLEALNLPQQLEAASFMGAVGAGPATEYLAFRKMAAALQSIDSILLDPLKAEIPSKPDQLYATAIGLAAKATEQNLSRVGQYCERLVQRERGEFAVLTLRDAYRRNPKLAQTEAFVRITSGNLGRLMSGTMN